MKPFNLELAKAGHPVCTRDGRRVKILSFDRKNKTNKPIISLLEDGEEEIIMFHSNNGSTLDKGDELRCDLMMCSEKKEGYMNIYENGMGVKYGGIIYETIEDAKDRIKSKLDKYVDTISVCWEE